MTFIEMNIITRRPTKIVTIMTEEQIIDTFLRLRNDIIQNGFTPHLQVETKNCKGIPHELINQNTITINVSDNAIRRLFADNNTVNFETKFNSVLHHIKVHANSIVSMHTKETNARYNFKSHDNTELNWKHQLVLASDINKLALTLSDQGDRVGANRKFEEAWKIFNEKLSSHHECNLDYAILMWTWGAQLSAWGHNYEATIKFKESWRLLGSQAGNHPELNDPEMELLPFYILRDWGHSLIRCNRISESIDKCEQAFLLFNKHLNSNNDLTSNFVGLLILWGKALSIGKLFPDAITKYEYTWLILDCKCSGSHKYDLQRVDVLTGWADCLTNQRRLSEALGKCEMAHAILEIHTADTEHHLEKLLNLLETWGSTLFELGRPHEANQKYCQAWQILEAQSTNPLTLDYYRCEILTAWGAGLLTNHYPYPEINKKFEQAWEIGGIKYANQQEYERLRFVILSHWADALAKYGHHPDARQKYIDAFICLSKISKDQPLSRLQHVILLTNFAATLKASGSYTEAIEKYEQAWSILVQEPTRIGHVITVRCALLVRWADALISLDHSAIAIEKLTMAWELSSQPDFNQSILDEERCHIFIQWGIALLLANKPHESTRKFEYAWNILTGSLVARRLVDVMLFHMINYWPICWEDIVNPHIWASRASDVLRERLMLQHSIQHLQLLDEYHHIYAHFHLTWMSHALDEGDCGRLVDILSRLSGWRMAQALLDEIDRAEGELPPDVEALQVCRRKVRSLEQELRVAEGAAGMNPTDFSSPIRGVVDEPSPDLKARIHALRQDYDTAYTRMREAQAKACQDPAYAALSSTLGFGSGDIQRHLTPDQAALLLVDTLGKKEDEDISISGLLLVRHEDVLWLPVPGLGEGGSLLKRYRTDFARGAGFRRSEPEPGETAQTDSAPLAPEAFWPHFADWIDSVLWAPLRDQGALTGIQKLTFVTHGRTHPIPWEMGAPEGLALARYPGLMLYGMQLGLMPRPANDDSSLLGLACYEGSDLPFAQIEAELIEALGPGSVVRPYDYLKPPRPVGGVHIAGHGVHPDSAPEQAHLRVGSGAWSLPALLASPARPKQVFLSACVAGRTSETDEGELYGVVAAFMQRGVREIVAATVDMNDPWMAALGVLTQRHVLSGLSQRAALARAKDDIRRGAWDWAVPFRQSISRILDDRWSSTNLKKRDLRACLATYATVHAPWPNTEAEAWVEALLASHDVDSAMAVLQPRWITIPPEPFLGPLLHAVIAFGQD